MKSIYALLFITFALCIYNNLACDLNTGSFGGDLGLPARLGFFNLPQINLNICSTAVVGSIPGYLQLLNGVFDLFTGTLTDNAFSRYYGPNLYPGQTIVMLGELGINSPATVVGVRYNITRYEDLKGKNILVDSPSSGFILTLRRILSLYNLFLERGDYNLIALGASRFPSLYQGYVTINGTNIPIACTVVSPPQGSQMTYDPLFYAPVVRSLGQLSDYVNPLSGSSVQTKPATLLNPTLRANIVKFLAAGLLGNRFAQNPDNKPYLVNLLRSQNPNTTDSYINFLYDYNYGSQAGLSQDYQFNIQGLLNTAYIKQQFGGSPYDQQDYGDLTSGQSVGIINYGPRDDALPIANSIGSVRVNVTRNFVFPGSCLYPAIDKTFTYSGIVAGVLAKTSGGCTSPIRATFLGCTSNSTNFYPAQCSYNSATDKLTFNSNVGILENTRYYTTSFFVREPCGGSYTFSQTIALNKLFTFGCTLLI